MCFPTPHSNKERTEKTAKEEQMNKLERKQINIL